MWKVYELYVVLTPLAGWPIWTGMWHRRVMLERCDEQFATVVDVLPRNARDVHTLMGMLNGKRVDAKVRVARVRKGYRHAARLRVRKGHVQADVDKVGKRAREWESQGIGWGRSCWDFCDDIVGEIQRGELK